MDTKTKDTTNTGKKTLDITKVKSQVADKKSKKATDLNKKNVKESVAEVKSQRVVKWIWPTDITDTISRKSWRQKMRGKIRTMERNIAKMEEGKEKAAAVKELSAIRKECLHDAKCTV